MSIQIPGYDVVIAENSVYVRKATRIDAEGQPVEGKEVLFLRRYAEPSEDDVIAYLQRTTEALPPTIIVNGPREIRSLEDVLKALPDQVKMDIIRGARECLSFIRSNTPAPAKAEGKSPDKYLVMTYAFVPGEMVAQIESQPVSDQAGIYQMVVSGSQLHKNGLSRTFELSLGDNGLPPQEEIAAACSYRQIRIEMNSAMRMVPLPASEAMRVKEALGAVYSAFSTPQSFSELPDVSEKMVRDYALPAVIALLRIAQDAEQARPITGLDPRQGPRMPPGLIRG